MVERRVKEIEEAVRQLRAAIALYHKERDQRELNFLMVAKAFEVLVEAAWKSFKRKVSDEGLDAPSPKESVRKAATLGLTESPEQWLSFIEARNLSVHDYFGLTPEKFLALAEELVKLTQTDFSTTKG